MRCGTMVRSFVLGAAALFLFAGLALAADKNAVTAKHVAMGAGIVGTAVFVIGLALSFILPEPQEEPAKG